MATYHHGDLPAALLRAAGNALEKHGLEALSLRDAARRAKVSHNAPYRHFKDRSALLAALAEDGFRMLGERLDAAEPRDLGQAYVGFALEHPQRFRLMCGSGLAVAARIFERFESAMKEFPRPQASARAAWSLVHGLACLTLEGQVPRDAVREVLGAVRFAQRAS
jgi:AcrR family transcriptional regulator